MTARINGHPIQTDNEGFLLDPADWSVELARSIAESEDLDMQEDHWMVVNFIRDFYEENQSVPQARVLLKAMRANLGGDKATRKHLYQLFPYGYGQQACKIAGMRKPLKLMLDL